MIIYDTVRFKNSNSKVPLLRPPTRLAHVHVEYGVCLICTDLALIWFHNSTGLMLRVFNVNLKNLAFDTSKIITNAWFSMKNYCAC